MLDRTTPPATYPLPHLSIVPDTSRVLDNGITMHTLSAGSQNVCKLTVYLPGGAAEASESALPGLTASMMREGTSKMSAAQISDAVDFNGAYMRTFAREHHTGVEIWSLNSRIHHMLPIMAQCVADPVFPQENLEVVRTRAASARSVEMAKVSSHASLLLRTMIAGAEHPHTLESTPEQILAIDRAAVVECHRSLMAVNEAHAFLSGKLDDEITEAVALTLNTLPQLSERRQMRCIPFETVAPEVRRVIVENSLQSAIEMGIPAIPRSHPDYNYLRLTVIALGGYFGSRLMLNIREDKGYTYNINSSLLGMREGAYVRISAQCDPKYEQAVIDEVRKELDTLATTLMPQEEMNRMLLNVSTQLAGTVDSPFTMMDHYETSLTVGLPKGYFEAQLHAIATITPETVRQMAQKYLRPEWLRIAVAGPKA